MSSSNFSKITAIFFATAITGLLLAGCITQMPQAGNANETSETNNPKTNAQNSSANDFQNGGSEMKTTQKTAKKGDTVSVDYIGTLEDGTLFDTSVESEAKKAKLPLRPSYEPLSFTVGANQMIKGFDDAVVGMSEGEEKTVKLPPSQAYGEKNAQQVIIINNTQLEQALATKPKVGMTVMTNSGASGTITSVNATESEIDFNHQLAGKTLIFKITLRKITAA